MNDFLTYLLNSAICLGLLYLLYRLLQRKETFFELNRIILLSIVLSSLIIPKLVLPQYIHKPIEVKMLPAFTVHDEKLSEYQFNENAEPVNNNYTPEKIDRQFAFSFWEVILYGYAAGFIISLLILFYGLLSVILLYRKAEIKQMEGYRILIVKKEIPAFSFGHLVFISRRDYHNHSSVILAHEKEHIRLNHFYDLIFLETVKIFYWFNPFIYWLIRDMKDIHEFQADDHTLTKGFDATQYQLLIIQKCVGAKKFALANSFNHFQIKNRIAMMNKQNTGKTWRWKVVAFLPLLALLLIFCGGKGGKVDQNNQLNRLDTIIYGKRLIVKDTTQYASSFIKELKESYMGYEALIVKDDSFLITSRSNQGVFSYKYTIPTNLELNKEIVFWNRNKDKSLVLKRTNYTNIEYQVKNEKETIKSGTAILQSTFYLGAEMDDNGKIASRQYLNLNSALDWASLQVEIYDAKIASLTYCVDPKAKIYETLSQLNRVPFDQNNNIPPSTFIDIDIKKEGIYLNKKLMTLDEFGKELPLKNSPQSNILINIIDKNNPDFQSIQNKLKEAGVLNKVKYTIPPPPFKSTSAVSIDIRKEGISIMGNSVTLDEFSRQLPIVLKDNPRTPVWVSIIDESNPNLKGVKDILKEARVSYHQTSNKDFSIGPYQKMLTGILDDLDKDKKLSIEQIQIAIPKNQNELGIFASYYADNNIYHKDIWKLYDTIIVEALKKNKNVFKSYLLMSGFVDGWVAEEYFDNIDKLIKNDKKFFCEMYSELPNEKITRLKSKFDLNCN